MFVVFVVFPERSKHGAERKQPGKGQTGYCGNMRAVTTGYTDWHSDQLAEGINGKIFPQK